MVTEPRRAVFLSYASQDSVVVSRICDALRDAGVSVWFDQNELRGGEDWDRQIRDRIQACRLFIAVVSANTESRDEGYFRREWKLAVDRTNDLAEDVPFLLPVLIDRTDAATARVPRKFHDVHWARLKDGEVSSDFIVRVMQLLGLNIATTVQHGASTELHADARSLPIRKRLLKRWWAPLIAGSVLAVGVIAYVWLADRRTVSVSAAAAHDGRAEVTSASMPERSLAVLPFVDMSEKRDQEYFADGMSEEILDVLARIPGLTVIGRTSSFQFKGKYADLKTIGISLGAIYVVEGSVRKSGSRIRVTAQLIDTRSGAHVWSESYDRDFGDTLLLQDQIATSVARTLQLAVTSAESVSRREPTSMDAYTLYLKGRVAFDRGDLAAFAEAQEDFEQALEIDPSFARAEEGVLLSYLNRVYAGAISNDVGWPRIQELAKKTLQLDPNSTFAHSALAWFHYSYDYDWSACNGEIDTVLTARSHDSTTLLYGGYVAGAIGRTDEGLRLIHEAIIFDPLSPDPYQALGGVLSYKGDYEGAERAFRRSLEISPFFAGSHLYIGETRLLRGRPQEALEEIKAERAGAGRDALLAATYFALGRKRDSDASLANLLESPDEDRAFWTAVAYALRHENDLAFEWLGKAYAQRELALSTGRTDYLAALHGDRRWKPFLRRMNIPE